MRFKVHSCFYPCGKNKSNRKKIKIILDNGLPAIDINRHLIINQIDRETMIGTPIYYLCIYLNYLNEHGIEVADATMSDIQNFLQELYIDGLPYSGKGTPKSYSAISDYVEVLSKLYDSLTLRGYKLDDSFYTQTQYTVLAPVPRGERRKGRIIKKGEHLTMVYYLIHTFKPSKGDIQNFSYTKWYSPEEIRAIADELPLPYRCIFLITVYTGFRIDSALSITMNTVNIYGAEITPTRSKTGKMHTASIPQSVADDLQSYLMTVRSNIDTDSEYFFVGRNGRPITYGAYREALDTARRKVNQKYGWNIESLHTHAGRSTFAAALRSYQLKCRREGVPTFSDVDFCNLMDWKSLDSLQHYDIVSRVQEVSPLLLEFYRNFDNVTAYNLSLIKKR